MCLRRLSRGLPPSTNRKTPKLVLRAESEAFETRLLGTPLMPPQILYIFMIFVARISSQQLGMYKLRQTCSTNVTREFAKLSFYQLMPALQRLQRLHRWRVLCVICE